jgi:hypothetical protein
LTDYGDCRRETDRKTPMRLASITAIAAVSAPLLASCLDDSKKPWMAFDRKCEQLGFKRGTPEHAKCSLELSRYATPRGSPPAAPD